MHIVSGNSLASQLYESVIWFRDEFCKRKKYNTILRLGTRSIKPFIDYICSSTDIRIIQSRKLSTY